ncbi:MAG: alanine--tRNA ligase [Bacteroidetes bacterium]|nr:MAG: alanine--tRNA ligase [Bacteroidota bacterium]
MTSQEIRRKFLDFFASKGHKIVPSAPIVNKNDPTLMFTNAGMNQFKDFFLGNATPDNPRIADTQKCLRVSGKHNDLEEVGTDGTHHTMFEMLGNWSIGDYFKKEAIAWAWELLTSPEWYGLPKDRLYASVFAGDPSEGLERDDEAADYWKEWLPEDHILDFGKKDNFWEMGDTGPCGPCSEIHIDLRPDEERARVSGAGLVNKDHPQVIEIWNLVFIQFNRKADRTLERLPATHVDTGMGFERLCLVLQGKTASYDTDIFTPLIRYIEQASGIKYTARYDREAKTDMAIRVVADHIRAVSFAIADGQLPENTGAGYVIRRILRRAVRYYYSFLGIGKPFLHELVPILADYFKDVFPELYAQKEQVARIIQGEEKTFLNTLERGIRRFENLEVKNQVVDGRDAFELYDTYGFPIDLTRLMATEKGWRVDEAGFEKALNEQKNRARTAAAKQVGDWTILDDEAEVDFVGYDQLAVENARVLKYREVKTKKHTEVQIVLDQTPFYGESGGQHGDKGWMWFGEEKMEVIDTKKDNDLIVHILKKMPADPSAPVRAEVNAEMRQATSANHSAVHLMHAALHRVLGTHALQKGQDVDHNRLRFDFSHFGKMTDEEIARVEAMVNQKIRENIALDEQRNIPIEEAKAAGALMLFGEKYGDRVRMITFDPAFSRELCGGTHVRATGEIGYFKILAESGVAAGIRRIEAVTAKAAEDFLNKELGELQAVRALFKSPLQVDKQVADLQEENKKLKKQIEELLAQQAGAIKGSLKAEVREVNGINFLAAKVPIGDSNAIKTLAYQLEKELGNAVIIFGAEIKGKPQLMVTISKNLTENGRGLHAGNIIRELAKEIKGGGGGQPFFATAGGKDLAGLDKALEKARTLV